MTTTSFTGFPQEATRFMQDLAENNDKEWFKENKPRFVRYVQEPAVALVEALGQRLQAEYPRITYEARAHNGSLMRIYRDTRFSKDKSPYKTNVAMMFMPAGYNRMQGPGFGLQMTLEQVELIVGSFAFTKPQLDLYREAVLNPDLGTRLEQAAGEVASAGEYPIEGKELKTVPRGYDKDHPRAEWLRYKGLHVFAPAIPLETAHTPALVDAAMAHFTNMAPVYHWLTEALLIE